jgi:serine/threonine protein kinase
MEKKNVHRPLKSVGDWNLTETLGQGSMGKVKLAVNGDVKMACKIVPKPLKEQGEDYQLFISDFNIPTAPGTSRKHQDNHRIVREVALSMVLSHPNIPQLKHIIVTKHHYYIFYELVKGTQLLDFIISNGKLKERMAKRFMWQILSALRTPN